MLPKERVRAAFEKAPTDRVPVHHVGFSSQVASMILGREAYVGGGIQQWREACALWQGEDAHREFLERSLRDAVELAVVADEDLVRLEYWRMPQKPSLRRDEYTFVYGDPDGDHVVYWFDPETEVYSITERHGPENVISDFDALQKHVAALETALADWTPTDESFANVREWIEKYGTERSIRVHAGYVAIPYDLPVWLEAILMRPDLIGRYLDTQAERFIRSLPHLAAAGAEYLFGGGDFAANTGPFYSPRAFHELMLPRLKRMTDACHAHGMFYLFASDGNLWPVADDLFGASGVDGYYEIDGRAGMDLDRLRERFPHLTCVGNLSSHTLHRGTPEEVAAEVELCMAAAGRHGGIVVGLSNYGMPGTPPENLEAMLEAIERLR